jgi:hypothetical protein
MDPGVRDRLLIHLYSFMTAGQIAMLRYEDIAVRDPKTGYVDVRRQFCLNAWNVNGPVSKMTFAYKTGPSLIIDDATAELLEDYLDQADRHAWSFRLQPMPNLPDDHSWTTAPPRFVSALGLRLQTRTGWRSRSSFVSQCAHREGTLPLDHLSHMQVLPRS